MRGLGTHRQRLAAAIAWAAALLAVVWLCKAVLPLQDDELMHYRLLRCMQPGTAISPRDDCTGFWDLNLLGTGLMVPLRVFWYSGVTPALFYAPLFALWRSYDSVRLLGALFLVAQTWLLARAYRLRAWRVFAGLLAVFPYAVQHLSDTGPVGYSITSVYLLTLLFRRWAAERRLRWGLCAAAVVALGVWTKLVFLWLVPGLSLLWLLEMRVVPRRHRLTLLAQGLAAAVAAGLLSAPFLLSTDPYEAGRLIVLEQLTAAKTFPFGYLLSHPGSIPAFQLLVHPSSAVHRLFSLPPPGAADAVFSLLAYAVLPACALFIAVRAKGRPRSAAVRSLWHAAAFWITLLCIARARQTWAMHHVILAFPFLVLAACELLAAARDCRPPVRRVLLTLAILFVAANLALYARLPGLTPRSEADWSRDAVHRVLGAEALSARYIYVTLDLGMYFYQTTFGPWDQMSIFREPFDAEWQGEQLREFSARTGRKLLFLYDTRARMSDMGLLGRMFTLRRCAAIPADAVWQVLYEPDGDAANPCGA